MKLVEIYSVQELEQFFAVAKTVYINDNVWKCQSENIVRQILLSGLRSKPKQMWPFVISVDEIPVGRAVAVQTNGMKNAKGQPEGWIAFFEIVQSYCHLAKYLFAKCEEVLARHGATSIVAPKANNLIGGLLISGFEYPHTFLTNYNPSHYLTMYRENGYEIKVRLRTFVFSRTTVNIDLLLSQVPQTQSVITRIFNRQDVMGEAAIFQHLQRSIFEKRTGYMKRSQAEDNDLVQSLLPILDDDLIIIAEDNQKRPLGLLICVPDAYQPDERHARIISIGVLPRFQSQGIGTAMGYHLMTSLLKKGYQTLEATWILEDNFPPQHLAETFQGLPGREYALLEKAL